MVRKALGLDRAAKLPRQLGHFLGVTNGLLPINEFLVASAKPFDFRLLADELIGSVGPSPFLFPLCEAVKGRQIGRVCGEQVLELPTLGFNCIADLDEQVGKLLDNLPKNYWPLGALNEDAWSYIRREGDLREELFDLHDDVKEQRDLAGDPAAQSTLERMRRSLGQLTGGPLLPQRFNR